MNKELDNWFEHQFPKGKSILNYLVDGGRLELD